MPKYISGDELADIIKDPSQKPWRDYLVIDVRDDDYAGGNILGSVNIPSRKYPIEIDNLIQKVKEKDVKLVVFHCSLSQQRGPKAASMFEETQRNLFSEKELEGKEVAILREGFSSFQVKFRHDPALVENWRKDIWESEY